MHYIRFLKPPRISPKDGSIAAKITITTDLGESFLALDIDIEADIVDQKGTSIYSSKSKNGYLWKGSTGMRALEIILPNPRVVRQGQILQMLVRPREQRYHVAAFDAILLDAVMIANEEQEWGAKGRVADVRSMPVDFSAKSTLSMDLAERVFSSHGSGDEKVQIRIWEETGESIARHIWDAGLVLSGYLSKVLKNGILPFQEDGVAPRLHGLEALITKEKLAVLELGAGCGIVGLTLGAHRSQATTIQLTDLPEATSILERNISQYRQTKCTSVVTQKVLDWSDEELPTDIASTIWDLVLVADCTYNPDVVPDLVKTLKNITSGKSRDALVCLAMKVRHESEMVFFELMQKAGFVVLEKGRIRLPVLADEDQQIEIFVFRDRNRSLS